METTVIAAPSLPVIRALIAVLLVAAAASVSAQQPLSLTDAAIRGQTIFEQSAMTGMVLVVVRNGEVAIKG